MANSLDIEDHGALLRFLRESGRLCADEVAVCTTLPGGVSNRAVLVERANGEAWVIKQALSKLRVAVDWFSAPARSEREARGLVWLERLAPPGTIPTLVFEDATHHLLAMQAVPRPHENWKQRLLSSRLERDHVTQFGQLLGIIHRQSHAQANELASVFADRTFFETLRLEPYYRFTASRHREAAAFFNQLITDTWAARLTLTHGDYSPKNILVHQGRLILIDHEVIHFGDPAFDVGFSVTHLLSKANHLRAQRAAFLEAAQWHWTSYQRAAGEVARLPGVEARAVRHTLACLLARVDGRSPLEYLTEPERTRQREVVLALIRDLPPNVPALIDEIGKKLNE